MIALIIVILYLGTMLVLSLFCAKKSGTSRDFFRGNGKSPWFVVALAMISTSISGVSLVSVPGMVEQSQFAYLQMVAGFVFGYIVIAFVLLPLYYKLKLNSLYEYLKQRFGNWSYKSGAIIFLISKLLSCGVKLYLSVIVLQTVLFEPLDLPLWLNIGLTMLVVWAYTAKGGVASIIWTDMLQTIVLLSTIILSIVLIAKNLEITNIADTIANSGMCQIFFFSDIKDTRFFWKQFLAGVFTTIAMTGLDQDMMQKNLSCRSLKDSQKNMLSYGVAFLPVNMLLLSLGVLLYLFAQKEGLNVDKADELFAMVSCGGYLSQIVSVLFVLGIISASFSSAGSALTALSSSFSIDILGTQDIKKVKRVHAAMAVLIGLVVCAFMLQSSQSAITLIYKMVSYSYGPLLGLFFFGILSKRKVLDHWVPIICLFSPIISLILSLNSERWLSGYQIGFELLLINALICFIGLWIGSKRQK